MNIHSSHLMMGYSNDDGRPATPRCFHCGAADAANLVNGCPVLRNPDNAPPGLSSPTPVLVETATQYHERTTRERERRQLVETDLYKSAAKYRMALSILCGRAVAYGKTKDAPNISDDYKQMRIQLLLDAAEAFAKIDE